MATYNFKCENRILYRLVSLMLVIFLIVLISPDGKCQSGGVAAQPFGEGIVAKKFSASAVDNNNVVWFLTESGILSFDGTKWAVHNKNPKISGKEIKDLDYDSSDSGNGLWVAGTDGATVIKAPVNAESEATTYSPDNSKIMSKNVNAVAVSKKGVRWFGTDSGISAFEGSNWLANNYAERYPEDIFQYFPLSTMATTDSGDTLYVGTMGGGVLRFFKDDVDAVSGASEYAVWGPILMPSDSVLSVYIAPDGTQWIGTTNGVAKHTGHDSSDGWTLFDKEGGLADNNVQAINSDSTGKLYFGTKNGFSILDGTELKTFHAENGLAGNNILTIAVDKNNVVWLGTDNGVTCFKNGEFISYK